MIMIIIAGETIRIVRIVGISVKKQYNTLWLTYKLHNLSTTVR